MTQLPSLPPTPPRDPRPIRPRHLSPGELPTLLRLSRLLGRSLAFLLPILGVGVLLGAMTFLKAPLHKAGASADARPTSGKTPSSQAVTAAPPVEAPIALSDPDGQELILEALDVRAAVHGMLSLTELELRFRNPQARRLEGRFSCVLPAGATISRFAKEVNGTLMEGEVVERLKAHQVYDTILHEMRDPALLEQDQGNRFSAKVFPIEANASVRLVLSYTRLLTLDEGVRTFAVPLRGLPEIGQFTFRGLFSPLPGEQAEGAGSGGLEGPGRARSSLVQVLELNESHYRPTEDVEVRWRPQSDASSLRLLQAGDFYLASVRAPLTTSTAKPPSGKSGWIFYVDTSASTAEGEQHRAAALAQVLSSLPAQDPVSVVAFDQTLAPLLEGSAGEVAAKVSGALLARHAVGGTRLDTVLADLQARARRSPDMRAVLVTDGVATFGQTELRALRAQVEGLPAGMMVQALVLGSRQDAPTLEGLTRGRGRVVSVPFTEQLTRRAQEAAARLVLPLGAEVSVADPNAEWVFPASFADVQPGSELLVVGKLGAGKASSLRLTLSGQELARADGTQGTLPLGAFAPLLEREGYRATLDYLSWREQQESMEAVRQALANEQVRVSVAHRVLCPRTTLLVLESEADYQRFGLERQSLADILVVGATGIEVLDRRHVQVTQPFIPPRPDPRPVTPPRPVTAERNKAGEARDLTAQRAASPKVPAAGPPSGDIPADGSDRKEARESQRRRQADDEDAAPASAEVAATGLLRAMGASSAPSESMANLLGAESADKQVEDRLSGGGGDFAPEPEAPRGSRGRAVTGGAPEKKTKVTRPSLPAWVSVKPTDEATVARLEEVVTQNPRDRQGYTQLSEALLSRKDWKRLLALVWRWQPADPENPQVYESLGEAALGLGDGALASRAFASLAELAGGKPELLQRAGLLLMRANALDLAEVPLRAAVEKRPDRVNAHRHLALFLWQTGRFEEAARVLEAATKRSFPNWYRDAQRIVREELGYVYRAWLEASPDRKAELTERAAQYGVELGRWDALRVTLVWETDANDVDLHVVDPGAEECSYQHQETATGLELYEDVTQGFGPEVMRTSSLAQGKYYVGVNYFSAGPMGVSRGVLVVLQPDARGRVSQPLMLPFRLVEGGQDIRLLATLESKGGKKVTP